MLPGKKLTAADVLVMARRRIWLIAIPPLVATFAALLYSSTIPNLYESDMLIAIDPQRVPDAFVRSTVTMETDRRMDAISVQVLSRTNLERLIEEFDLYQEERRTLPMDDVLLKMRQNIRVDLEFPRPRWGASNSPTAFHVRFTYPNPVMATTVTQRIGTLYVEQNALDRGSLAGATNRFLESQLAEARQGLEAQERKLETFRQRHGNELPTQQQSNLQAVQNAQMRAQSLVESIARDKDRKQMLERLYAEAAAEPAPLIAAYSPATGQPTGTTPILTRAQQLAAARASLAALDLRYTETHPDVIRAKRLVAELESKADDPVSRPGSGSAPALAAAPTDPVRAERLRQMAAEIESLQRQTLFKESEESKLRVQIAEYQRRLEAVPGLESEWISLTRDYDTRQTAYKELLTKSTAAQVAADLETQEIGERFRIVDAARVPVRPLQSLRVRYNAGGLVLGMLFGLGLAAFLEFKDSSFRSEADVLDILALPVLASVPTVESTAERLRKRHRRLVLSTVGLVAAVGAGYLTWTMKLWSNLI